MDSTPSHRTPASYSITRQTVAGEMVKLVMLWIVALIASFMSCILLSGLVLFVLLDLKDETSPDFLFPAVAGVIFLGSLALSWQFMKRMFHFRLDILDDRLQTSALWMRDSLDVLEVEGIRLVRQYLNYPDSFSDHVEIIGGGKLWKLYLYEKNADCIEDLLAVCPNAVYIDERGQEHPPRQPCHPEKVQAFLARRMRRDGIVCIGAGSLATLLALFMAIWPVVHGEFKDGFSAILHGVFAIKFVFMLTTGIGAIGIGIHKIREAKAVATDRPIPSKKL